jgi:hypothetical protein
MGAISGQLEQREWALGSLHRRGGAGRIGALLKELGLA